jgi:hypothetical protein
VQAARGMREVTELGGDEEGVKLVDIEHSLHHRCHHQRSFIEYI